MKTEIEIELKAMLTLPEYQRIYNYYSGTVETYTIYYLYFDPIDGNLVRIKKSANQNILTLKTRVKEFTNTEKSFSISNEKCQELINNPNLISNYFKLDLNGFMVNKQVEITRKTIKQKQFVLMLDKTRYANDTVDYELEVEFKEEKSAHVLMSELLETHQIKYVRAKTKIERTIEKEIK